MSSKEANRAATATIVVGLFLLTVVAAGFWGCAEWAAAEFGTTTVEGAF